MAHDTPLDTLAARWAAGPDAAVFAPLADGLRKRGELLEAARVVTAGLARFPGHPAGLIVQARIATEQGDAALAERALAELLERDPEHPLALELAAQVAPALLGEAQDAEPIVLTDEAEEEEAGAEDVVPGHALVTESLAALYHRQGHLEAALEAYRALVERDPANDRFAERQDAIRRELLAGRPLPFDAAESGGRSVAEWLGALAAVRPAAERKAASYDAFFAPTQAEATPRDATADFDAFQRWLQELGR